MKQFTLFAAISLALVGCEQEWTDMPTTFDGPEIVVEAYVENSDNANPPYVILTKSTEYLDTIGLNELNDLFIHDAEVWITDGIDTAFLTEICWSDLQGLDSTLLNNVLQGFGIPSADSIGDLNWCAYVDVNSFFGAPQLIAQEGRTYSLYAKTTDNKVVRASTTTPQKVLLDSIWYTDHPDFPDNDTLVQMNIRFHDPGGIANYYRVFTKQNDKPMVPQGFQASVSDDKIVDGQEVEFFVSRGQSMSEPFDQETFGYFWRGDTIVIRFATLDYTHFRFWKTSEYNTGSQGPFGSYVRIESNIEGGLGIFGGISYTDYTIVVPE